MYSEHRTKDGKKMYVSQMDDRHLMNTIKVLLKGIEDAKKVSSQEIPISKLQKTMYKMSDRNVEKKAERMMVAITEKLYPYISEATLRGIDIKADLQRVFERSSADVIVTLSIDDNFMIEDKHYREYEEIPEGF